jgi:hypothetical protein
VYLYGDKFRNFIDAIFYSEANIQNTVITVHVKETVDILVYKEKQLIDEISFSFLFFNLEECISKPNFIWLERPYSS